MRWRYSITFPVVGSVITFMNYWKMDHLKFSTCSLLSTSVCQRISSTMSAFTKFSLCLLGYRCELGIFTLEAFVCLFLTLRYGLSVERLDALKSSSSSYRSFIVYLLTVYNGAFGVGCFSTSVSYIDSFVTVSEDDSVRMFTF